MAGTHGGARAGAGRTPKRVKFSAQVDKTEKKLAAHGEKAAKNLIKLADGGFERVTETWKAAGLVQVVRTEMVEGPQGPKVLRFLEPAFPDLEPDALVCIERKREVAEPDRAANEYIIDRIAGRPTVFEDEPESKEPVKANDEARLRALEKTKAWRKQSQEQLASIRNPLTGHTLDQSEPTSDVNSSLELQMTDDF